MDLPNCQDILDGMGQGVLIFDSGNRLVMENLAARSILGVDLKSIREQGWTAASKHFNHMLKDDAETIEVRRSRAMSSPRPVRFHIFRSGEYIPCWMAAIHGAHGEVFTMITIDVPDWAVVTELIDQFRSEVVTAISTTQGHIGLIEQTIKNHKAGQSVEMLGERITNFTTLISTHMYRLNLLMQLLERLEAVRTGNLHRDLRAYRRKIKLADFMEDFLEELDAIDLLDPETEAHDYRARISTEIPDDIFLSASVRQVTSVLRDLLRNAIMYSEKTTPIKVMARLEAREQIIFIDVIDRGYGIRESEYDAVFLPFKRARQPQVISEFGYGLSLYLCQQEVEAMNGELTFTSKEGEGTTFHVKLPAWREGSSGDFLAGSPSESDRIPPA
ncbi:MAG: sensor histidine kinase [Chloroflexi bacterium]|nr:MAG: sensor histidine kinase [Chloroflexota bacterium]